MNFRLEYISCLQALGLKDKINQETEKLKQEFPDQIELISMASSYNKQMLFDLWNNSSKYNVSEKAEEIFEE